MYSVHDNNNKKMYEILVLNPTLQHVNIIIMLNHILEQLKEMPNISVLCQLATVSIIVM